MGTPNRDSHGRFIRGSGHGTTVHPEAIQHVKAKLHERARHARPHRVSVGIHEADGATAKLGPDGQSTSESVVRVATAHEFGFGVPDRSWLRTWFDSSRKRHSQELVAMARAEFKGDAGAVEQQAQLWARELQQWIQAGEGSLEKLQPSTISEKQRAGLSQPDTPLVATKQLVEAIKSIVDGG